MLKTRFKECLEKSPVIIAVRDTGWQEAIDSSAKIIFFCKANIMTIKEKIAEAHVNDKMALVHIDLNDGIGKDKTGIEFLAKCGVDGIITTRGNLIRYAREAGLIAIQRFFALDAMAVSSINDLSSTARPDYIEIMPGVINKVIKSFAKGACPVIVSGLIENKEEIESALSCGAVAISTSKTDLWNI